MPLDLGFGELIGWAISLLSVVTTVVVGLVKLLLVQFEKRLGEKFAAQDSARKEATKHWEESFAKVLGRQEEDSQALRQLERTFLEFQAKLPIDYVRREDWASGQFMILAKLDGLALRYENILLKGSRQ